MKKDYARLNTKIYNVPLARRFKARLMRKGVTYRAWLAGAMKNYLVAKPTIRTTARKAGGKK